MLYNYHRVMSLLDTYYKINPSIFIILWVVDYEEKQFSQGGFTQPHVKIS